MDSKYHKNAIVAGVPLQTPLGKLGVLSLNFIAGFGWSFVAERGEEGQKRGEKKVRKGSK